MTGSPPILCLLGPTAVGKSALGMELAERLGGEIVCADSAQVYRGLEAATAKPTPGERARVPHHCLDLVGPEATFSAGDFLRAATAAVAAVQGRGRRVILGGGTGFYLRRFFKGLFAAPPREERLRARLRALAERRGVPFLHRFLAAHDPALARSVGGHDRQRLVRFLEVALLTGRPPSALWNEPDTGADRMPVVKVGLTGPRAWLYARIDARVERFYARGLIEEVERLLAGGLDPACHAFQAIGYREAVAVLAGTLTREEAVARTQRRSRQYAKRQLTWFRKEPEVRWLDAADPAGLREAVLAFLPRS